MCARAEAGSGVANYGNVVLAINSSVVCVLALSPLPGGCVRGLFVGSVLSGGQAWMASPRLALTTVGGFSPTFALPVVQPPSQSQHWQSQRIAALVTTM